VVPANIAELLTVRALAYWIMDEGGKERKIATELVHNPVCKSPDSKQFGDVSRNHFFPICVKHVMELATELLFFTLVLSLLPMYYYFKPL
jgi:hypothetical protein